MANTRFTFKEATEKREIVAYHAAMSFTSYNRDWCVNHKDEEGWYFLDNANRCPIEFYEAVKEFQPYGSRFYGLERAKNIKKDVGWFKNKGFVVSEKAIEDIYYVGSNYGVLACDPCYLNTDEFDYDNPFGYNYVRWYVKEEDWCEEPYFQYRVWNEKDNYWMGAVTYEPHKSVRVDIDPQGHHPILSGGMVRFIEYGWMKYENLHTEWSGGDYKQYTYTDKYMEKYGLTYSTKIITDEKIVKISKDGKEETEWLIDSFDPSVTPLVEEA